MRTSGTPKADVEVGLIERDEFIPNTGVRLQGGKAPPPQQDTQYELGTRRTFLDRKVTAEIGLFDITRDHVAIANPANSVWLIFARHRPAA